MESMIRRDEFCKSVVEEMMPRLEALAGVLYDRLADGDWREVDRWVRPAVLKLGDDCLASVLSGSAAELKQRAWPCPRCGKQMRFKQMRTVEVRTGMTGEARTLPSPYFVCEECHVGQAVLRQALGLDEDGFTGYLRELSVKAGVIEPFEAAAEELLGEMVGVKVSGSKVHVLCQQAGEVGQALMNEGRLGQSRKLEKGEKLYVEMDGGMLRVDQEWREVKVGIAFPSKDLVEVSKNRRQIHHRRVCATLGLPEDLGRMLYAMVESYLPKRADGAPIIAGNVVVLADGSPWIKNLVEEILPGATMILDWFHVAEHVAEAGLALHPENETARRRWRSRQLGYLRRGEVQRMLRLLADTSMKLPAGSSRQEAIANLHRYLAERESLLVYAKARTNGLIIGSGAIESAVGHVLQQRMKRSGMRWKSDGAKSMAALRSAYRSQGGMAALLSQLDPAA